MTQEDQLFDFRKVDTPPILLIVDRRDDPVTPLLTQWTYQAMVHELLGINNGKVDLRDVPDIRPEMKVMINIWSLFITSLIRNAGNRPFSGPGSLFQEEHVFKFWRSWSECQGLCRTIRI